MKQLLLFLLITSIYTLNGQSADEVIQQIRRDYAYINNEIIPQSAKVRLVRTWDHMMLFLVEDEIMNPKFDSSEVDGVREGYDLYFYQDDTEEKWKLAKVVRRSSFGEGYSLWRDETVYYFRNQKLIFSYALHIVAYLDEDEEIFEDYILGSLSEDRFYYTGGRLIRHLYKETERDNKYSLSLKELIDQAPLKEMPITPSLHAINFKETINMLVENWGHGAEKPQW